MAKRTLTMPRAAAPGQAIGIGPGGISISEKDAVTRAFAQNVALARQNDGRLTLTLPNLRTSPVYASEKSFVAGFAMLNFTDSQTGRDYTLQINVWTKPTEGEKALHRQHAPAPKVAKVAGGRKPTLTV